MQSIRLSRIAIFTIFLVSGTAFASPQPVVQELARSYRRNSLVGLSKFKNHPKFGDHVLARIISLQLKSLDDKANSGKRFTGTNELEQLKANLTNLNSNYPESPWQGSIKKWWGKYYLFKALQNASNKSRSKALTNYEQFFVLAHKHDFEYEFEPLFLQNWLDQCKPDLPSCQAWAKEWRGFFKFKNTIEFKTLLQTFPDLTELASTDYTTFKEQRDYPKESEDETAWKDLQPSILEKSYKSVRNNTEAFLEKFPGSAHRFRARYWLGRATEETKKIDDSTPFFNQLFEQTPLSWYGLLASWKIGRPLTERLRNSPPVEPDPLSVNLNPNEARLYARGSLLLNEGLTELARADLHEIRMRSTLSSDFLYHVAIKLAKTGSYLKSYPMITELIARKYEPIYCPEVSNVIFPKTEFQTLAEQNAVTTGLDPWVILSLIKQESAFDQAAFSSSGAAGLMQLMPFTASEVEPTVSRKTLLEPATNIRLGSLYLKKMVDRYPGKIAVALAAYNAGPSRADIWVKEGKTSGTMIEFIEQIPFRETRDYVSTIFRNYVWFRKLYQNEETTNTDAFWKN